METEIFIAADDPVRLVSAVVERMDIGKIERSYSQDGRNEYPPRILLKVMIYAYMRLIFSSREIEHACRENICFMYSRKRRYRTASFTNSAIPANMFRTRI
ncbi:MAG: transposase [Eubacteriales bacterium]|jgi:transposase